MADLRINHDDTPDKVIDKVNVALKRDHYEFVRIEGEHDGYEEYRLACTRYVLLEPLKKDHKSKG